MGLLDVLNGMQNGPRGKQEPVPDAGGGGMSKITMALLGLIAYKAFKNFTSQPSASPAAPAHPPGAGRTDTAHAESPGGGLGGLLSGGALSAGLSDLMKQFQQSGHGDVAKSWVDTGPNRAITRDQLAKTLSDDQIRTLSAQTGLSQDELLDALSQHLPEVVNRMTPNGRVPAAQEISRLL